MALDPRIALAGVVPSNATALNLFENALTNAQNRGIKSAQEARAAELQPLAMQQQQQTVDTNAQTLAANRDKQRIINLNQTGQRLKPFLVNNDVQGATNFVLKNISNLQDRIEAGENLDLTESFETLRNLQEGNIQQVADDIGAVEQIYNQSSGAAKSTKPAAVQETEWYNQQTPEVQATHLKIQRGDQPTRAEELTHQQALANIDIATTKSKEDVKATAGRKSNLIAEESVNRRAAKKSMVKLSQVAKLAEGATQGIVGQAKLLAGRFFPGIDVTDEAALSGAYKGLALDELSKFKGPTTDFEFRITEDIAGTLGDGASANKARTASLQRAAWFANRQADQFDKWIDDGHNPDRFSFNMNEAVTFGKGDRALTITLQDVQDSAVAAHVSIDEAMRRLRKATGGK